MNLQSPISTAVLRGVYLAVITGAIAFLTAWQTTDELKGPVTVGLLAGLGTLTGRGLLEGGYDQRRQDHGSVKPSDVGQ